MPTIRLPLSWPFNPRAQNTTTKDPDRINVMDEVVNEKTYTLKRPGTSLRFTPPAGTGQGMTFYNGGTYSVTSDTLQVSSANASGTSGLFWPSAGNAPWSVRSSFGTITINGSVYIIGGLTDAGGLTNIPTSDVWSITPGTGWIQNNPAAPWDARAETAVGQINNVLFIMGGAGVGPIALSDVWSSSDQGVTWEHLTDDPPWPARYGASAISADNGIYLMGGTNQAGTYFNDIWFTTDGVTWAEVVANADWPVRAYAAHFYFPKDATNALWIVGGSDAAGNAINDAWYSTDGGKNWTDEGAVLGFGGVYAAGFIVYNNEMWIANGRTGPAVATSTNNVYHSSDGATWNLVAFAGPWQPSSSGVLVTFPTLTSISPYNYQTMYWLGGVDVTDTKTNLVYYSTLDLVVPLSIYLAPPITGQQYQFAAFQEGQVLLVKNQSMLWVVQAGKVEQVTDSGYPGETAVGIAVLGDTAYVLDRSGLIHNCASDNPFRWPLLNAVGADYEPDLGVALVKYLNYLVAFGAYTTQFFYDAGKAVGSPLLPYVSANSKVGCAAAATVVEMGATFMWLGRTLQYNRQVMIMNGLTPQVVSTPAVEKFLNKAEWNSPSAISVYAGGHLFYVLSPEAGLGTFSLAFDTSTKQWFKWTDAAGTGPWRYSASCSDLDINGFQVQSATDGKIYRVGVQYYSDDGTAFPVTIVTDKVDLSNNRRKFWGLTTIIGDRNTGTPRIQTTDDDYQSYNTGRTVNMATARPCLYRNGSSRRRAWKITQTDIQPMRLEYLEIDVEQGGVQLGNAGG